MTFFLQAFVTLFVIIDPPGTVPIFIGLTRGRSARTKRFLQYLQTILTPTPWRQETDAGALLK